MGSAALGITILTAQMTGTGRQRKRQVTIGCAIHNPTAENLEHVTLRADLITAQGFFVKGGNKSLARMFHKLAASPSTRAQD